MYKTLALRKGKTSYLDLIGHKKLACRLISVLLGTYTMPSCHVEEMYKIDNFSDSETATVIIE